MARRGRTIRHTPMELTWHAKNTGWPLQSKAVEEYVAAGWKVFGVNSANVHGHRITVVCVSKTFGNVGGKKLATISPNGRFDPTSAKRVTWNWMVMYDRAMNSVSPQPLEITKE